MMIEAGGATPSVHRILVVDDDPSVLSVLKRGLAYEGFAVDTASDGVEGLRVAGERSPDLVILDIMMPGLDGLEVLRRLRVADAQLPIVMLTAKDAPADQVAGLERGADDYVVKPFTFECWSRGSGRCCGARKRIARRSFVSRISSSTPARGWRSAATATSS
jgi:CheY-like chemotaxis protein